MFIRLILLTLATLVASAQTSLQWNPFTGKWDLVGSSGGGSGATSVSGLTDLQVTKTSSTVITIAAGSNSIGGVITAYSAATATISGSTATSDTYVYIDSSGVLTAGHNGITTVTCSGCTTVTGVTSFPFGSRPLAIVPYVSNVWGTPVDKRTLSYQFVPTSGSCMSVTQQAGGDWLFSGTCNNAFAVKSYSPWGWVQGNSGNGTTVFTANETRWVMFNVTYPISFNRIGVYAATGIGGGAGIRAAVATLDGTITNTSDVLTTCASSTNCLMTFASTVTLSPGQYYIGITTDSTVFQAYQTRTPYQTSDDYINRATGYSTSIMGTGTAGSGTGGSVAFAASRGSLTKWTGDGEALGKWIEVVLDTQ